MARQSHSELVRRHALHAVEQLTSMRASTQSIAPMNFLLDSIGHRWGRPGDGPWAKQMLPQPSPRGRHLLNTVPKSTSMQSFVGLRIRDQAPDRTAIARLS